MSESVGLVRANVGALLDAAPDAVVLTDEDGRILLVNRQAERLFGWDRAELLGEPVEVLVPQGALARHPQERAGYVRRPRNRPMGEGRELAGRRKDGSEFPAEIWLSSVRTDQGTLVSAAVRDLTERRRTEERHQGLLDAAPDAIVAVDQHGAIRLANRQAEALFGYPRDELLGQGIAEDRRVEAAFHDAGKAVGIGNAQPIHRQFAEMIVVGREHPRSGQGPISQDQLLVEPLVEVAHGGVAVRGEGPLGDTGP